MPELWEAQVSDHPKFVQLACTNVRVFALDIDGNVWRWDSVDGWEQV